jgi:hypothetical protein
VRIKRDDIVCDWCGAVIPAPSKKYTELPDGWGWVFRKVMCPRCAKERLEMEAKP